MQTFLMLSTALTGDKSTGKTVYMYILLGIKRKKYTLFSCSHKSLTYAVYHRVLLYIYFARVFFEYMSLLHQHVISDVSRIL